MDCIGKKLYDKYKGKNAERFGSSGIIVGYDKDEELEREALIMVVESDTGGWEFLDDVDIIVDEVADGSRFDYCGPEHIVE